MKWRWVVGGEWQNSEYADKRYGEECHQRQLVMDEE